MQSVAFKDSRDAASQTIEEDNDLYCTSSEGVFSVRVLETEASKRCRLDGKSYTLVVAASDIKLMDGDIQMYTWPYRSIRRYGYGDGKFTFEAGRKCESGEGSFHLEHSNQQEIFRCIASKMKSMRKKLLNADDHSPSAIDCNDAQYHAALSMEAGSRSPLPPSPSTSIEVINDFSTISQNTQKHAIGSCSSSSVDSISFIRPPPPIVKPKPAKPPRKYIFPGLLDKKSCYVADAEFADSPACGKYRKLNQTASPEIARKCQAVITSLPLPPLLNPYDVVEVRCDAWRTHGLDNVPHTEKMENHEGAFNDDETTDVDDNGSHAIANSKSLSTNGTTDNYESQYEVINMAASESEASMKRKLVSTETSTKATVLPVPASPIIHNNLPSADSPNYDKLQHFGSMHKLSSNNPGYKVPNVNQSVGASIVPSVFTGEEPNQTWSNYDLVEDMCAVRLADDTHHGYGIIRKKTNPPSPSTSTSNASVPQYRLYNDTEYAIVSKPKRV